MKRCLGIVVKKTRKESNTVEEYNMIFFKMLDEIFETKGKYVGENFPIGTYISVNGFGSIGMYQIQEDGDVEYDVQYEGSLNITEWLIQQKYKRL